MSGIFEEPYGRQIGRRIAKARRRLAWDQKKLAEKMQAHPSAVSHWETGRRSPDVLNLRKLCTALDVSADYLLDVVSPPF